MAAALPSPSGLGALFERSARARYAGAAGLVLLTIGVRFLVDSIMVGSLGMAFFYPAVILAAYWMGARPAILAAVLSTAAVLTFQAASSGALTLSTVSWVILLLFVITSGLAIYLISAIRAQLRQLADANGRTEALVLSQASLFRDHAERVTNHLQLIAAILQHTGRAADETEAARVLNNAASRTLLISRMHREFAGDRDRTVDFQAFARKLAQAAAPDRHIEIRGEDLHLPPEQATALGLVLLDRLNGSRGLVAIKLEAEGGDIAFRMAVEELIAPTPAPRDILLLEAVAAQLRGQLEVEGDADLSVIRLTFPAALQPPPAWTPLEHAVH